MCAEVVQKTVLYIDVDVDMHDAPTLLDNRVDRTFPT